MERGPLPRNAALPGLREPLSAGPAASVRRRARRRCRAEPAHLAGETRAIPGALRRKGLLLNFPGTMTPLARDLIDRSIRRRYQ